MGVAGSRGSAAEDLVAAYLALIGWTVCGRNVRIAGVEVDLVARQDRTTVLVEVKYRTRLDFGGAGAAVDGRKRERLRRAALATSGGRTEGRIDVVSVERTEEGVLLRHHCNAVTA